MRSNLDPVSACSATSIHRPPSGDLDPPSRKSHASIPSSCASARNPPALPSLPPPPPPPPYHSPFVACLNELDSKHACAPASIWHSPNLHNIITFCTPTMQSSAAPTPALPSRMPLDTAFTPWRYLARGQRSMAPPHSGRLRGAVWCSGGSSSQNGRVQDVFASDMEKSRLLFRARVGH